MRHSLQPKNTSTLPDLATRLNLDQKHAVQVSISNTAQLPRPCFVCPHKNKTTTLAGAPSLFGQPGRAEGHWKVIPGATQGPTVWCGPQQRGAAAPADQQLRARCNRCQRHHQLQQPVSGAGLDIVHNVKGLRKHQDRSALRHAANVASLVMQSCLQHTHGGALWCSDLPEAILFSPSDFAVAALNVYRRQVSDAIPIPGFLDSLQPTVQAARAANTSSTTNTTTSSSASSSMPSQEEGSSSSSEGQLLAVAAATLPLAEQQQLLLAGAAPALEQLSSVVNEVGVCLTVS